MAFPPASPHWAARRLGPPLAIKRFCSTNSSLRRQTRKADLVLLLRLWERRSHRPLAAARRAAMRIWSLRLLSPRISPESAASAATSPEQFITTHPVPRPLPSPPAKHCPRSSNLRVAPCSSLLLPAAVG